MDKKDEEFRKRILATFRTEAEEHLNAFSADLIDLEKTQTEERLAEITESMFREIHSLKGAARSVDQKEVETICQPLESVFSAFKRKEIQLSPSYFDLFHKIVKCTSKLITGPGSAQTADDKQLHRELIKELNEIVTGNSSANEIKEPKKSIVKQPVEFIPTTLPENETIQYIPKTSVPISTETVRIRIEKLDPLLLQAEELIQAKKANNQRKNELQEINTWITGWKTDSLKWKGQRLEASPTLWNEWSEVNEACLNKLESQLAWFGNSMERDKYNLDNMVDNHLEAMRQILMLPISSFVEVFPGMVREISRQQNKEIEFIIRGTELEMDKRILEELKDPLIHLIRNSIDHGISMPQERILKNKPPNGTIILAFTAREGGMVEITLTDDGKGINYENVIKSAIKTGLISKQEAEKLGQKEILSLIYQSGVSTSPIITDISGRGLGMSIVQEKVQKLNGKIAIETKVNEGTTFHILLPMTLATFRGIQVRMGEFMFFLPTINVEKVMKVKMEDIKTVENHETILINGKILSIADLGEVLELSEHIRVGLGKAEPGLENSNQIWIVVLVSGENHIAFKVDEVVDEQQILVKNLGKLLSRVKNISNATILGSGKVVPILHVNDLMKSALKSSKKIKGQIASEKSGKILKKILVSDDSITSRTLIKNILETAGYKVSTAVDGTDAFTQARSNKFDLIVSDVDMPRMNGFELTTKIRHDKKLSEVPVVLITALGSQEDRERGIEVGADAYIIKSNFDQNNLLEIVARLI